MLTEIVFGCFVFSASWALLDELHQSFTKKRGGSIWDSLLDSSGALFMLIAISIVARKPRIGTPLAEL